MSSTARRLTGLCVVAALALPGLARAQLSPALPEPVVEPPAGPGTAPGAGPRLPEPAESRSALDELVVLAAKRPQTLREAPASSSIITRADLEAFGWRDFNEAIASLAGFYTTDPRDSTYIGVRGISQRGDNNGRILILIDGHAQNELWSHAAYPELAGLDQTMIDHIEVLRGPASALYGSLGFLAIINVVTVRGTENRWGQATFEMRNADAFKGVLNFAHRFSNGLELGISAQALGDLGRSYDYADRAMGPCTDGLPKSCLTRSDPSTDAAVGGSVFAHLEYKGFWLRGSYQAYDKNLPFAPYRTIFNDQNKYRFERAYVDAGYVVGTPSKAEATFRGYFDYFRYHDELATSDDGTAATRYVFKDDARPFWAGLEAKLFLEREWRKLRFAFTAGGEFTWIRGNSMSGPDDPTYGTTVNIQRDLFTGATYAQAEVGYARRLFLTAGLRGDFSDAFPNALSPRVALVLRPYSSGTFKLLYSHGFIRPSWYVAFFNDNVSILDNPRLRPEQADNYEVVWQQEIAQYLVFTSSFFYIHGEDLIDQTTVCVPETPEAPHTPDCPDGQSVRTQRNNVASFQSIGAEVGVQGRLPRGVRIYANYTYAHATDGNGTRAFNSPEHLAKAGLSVPLWRRHLFFGTEARVISSRQVSTDPADGETPAVFLWDAFLAWRDLPRGLSVMLKVKNLLGTTWTEPSTAEDSFPIKHIPHYGPTVWLRLSYAH